MPRITESFMDTVAEALGWRRCAEVREPSEGESNADYIAETGDILELKIFEEEGLEKSDRQSRIAELYRRVSDDQSVVHIDLQQAPAEIRRELETLVSKPLKSAIKKASRQIRQSRSALATNGTGVLIAINNGYSSLDADAFERLIVRRCRNDSSSIDHVACVTVDYHQGAFDAFIFCIVRSHAVRDHRQWPEAEQFQAAVHDAFSAAMTQMMADQMNPRRWAGRLDPVTDIRFVRDGVEYILKAPEVPDSRFADLDK